MGPNPHRRDMVKFGASMGLASWLAEPTTINAAETTSDALRPVHNRGTAKSAGPYMMPAHFGPLFDPELIGYRLAADSVYGDVTNISIMYRTDADRLRRYLPTPFELTAEPMVRVYYSLNRQVDWMANGAYNLMGVDVSAEYRGTVDRIMGSYCLVLWENQTEPILMGRERGIPKIFGDIDDHQVTDGVWKAHLSHGGHPILDLEASDLHPLSPEACRAMEQGAERSNWMGWRYVPGESGEQPLASYATCFPARIKVREAWTATGKTHWHRQTWAENPLQAHIVNALESLPMLEMRSCTVWKGSTILQAGKVRRLV